MSELAPLMLERSRKNKNQIKVLTIVLDGVGYVREGTEILTAPSANAFHMGNAVNAAYTPHLYGLYHSSLFRTLKAHGTAVGLPSDDDMGNSEVGHNTIGCGRIFAQGAKLVNEALSSGRLFQGDAWRKLIEKPELKAGKNTLHFCGLFSDGNVHSHIAHLLAMIERAKKDGVKRVRLHLLLDGRDTPPTSALKYVEQLEAFLTKINDSHFDCQVASGGGRMAITMDRYESDWSMVERGYNTHVLGEGRSFVSLRNAIETLRTEVNVSDQNLPPFVIFKDKKPVGPVEDRDSFILFNFRGDRAIQISRALTEETFHAFKRKRFPRIDFAGMMQYDGDLHIPPLFLVTPSAIDNTMTELLSRVGVKQFACSETQKYGHVTYFWNGNRSGKFNEKLEHYVEIPSDKISFDERPWMKCAEIAEVTIAQMRANAFEVGRINFANGDMVGHTGNFQATVAAVANIDLALGQLMQAAQETNTILLVTADHGNADEMYELDKKTKQIVYDDSGKPRLKTSHTLAPVPFALFNTEILGHKIELAPNLPHAGLAHIAATVLELAGFTPPSFYEKSLVQISNSNGASSHPKSLLRMDAGHTLLPTLNYGVEISRAAWDVGFSWQTLKEVFADVTSEVQEVAHELEQNPMSLRNVEDEIGDVVYSLCNVVNILRETHPGAKNFDFDTMARSAFQKFTTRFVEMEKIMRERGEPLVRDTAQKLSMNEWMDLWRQAKKRKYK